MSSYGGYERKEGGFSNSLSSPETQKNKTPQPLTLRPVTIKQLLDATSQFPDSPLKLDGGELTQVLVIAKVVEVSISSNNITYRVEDGTGMIDVRKFVDSDDQDQPVEDDLTGQYIRILGRIKVFQDKKVVDSAMIRPVSSIDEITYHALLVVHTHLSLTRPAKGKRPGNESNQNQNYTNAAMQEKNFSPDQRRILALIQQYSHTTEGADVRDLVHKLRDSMTESFIRNEIANLTDDGVLYTGMDQDHYKVSS